MTAVRMASNNHHARQVMLEEEISENWMAAFYCFSLIFAGMFGIILAKCASSSRYVNHVLTDISVCSTIAAGFFALVLYLDTEMTFLGRVVVKCLYFLISFLLITSVIGGCSAFAVMLIKGSG